MRILQLVCDIDYEILFILLWYCLFTYLTLGNTVKLYYGWGNRPEQTPSEIDLLITYNIGFRPFRVIIQLFIFVLL